jgi:hypothetical protein
MKAVAKERVRPRKLAVDPIRQSVSSRSNNHMADLGLEEHVHDWQAALGGWFPS